MDIQIQLIQSYIQGICVVHYNSFFNKLLTRAQQSISYVIIDTVYTTNTDWIFTVYIIKEK